MKELMSSINKKNEAKEIVWETKGRWWTGKMNLLNSVNRGLDIPSKIRPVDLTLREGEEVPDTVFSETEKVELAFEIQKIGFKEFEIGYAGVIPEHYHLVKRLIKEGFTGKISSHTRIYGRSEEWKKEIDKNIEAGAQILTLVGCATEVGTATTPWLKKEDTPERIANCTRYAKNQGAVVTFGLADLIRTSFEKIVSCYQAAIEAGVDRLYIYDAMGAARPEAIRFLTRFIKDLAGNIEIGVHVHNNFGLSQANALAALTSGANVVDVVPLGLGDGAGITASEEIVSAMEILYGVRTGIQLDQLRPICQRVAKLFKIQMPKTKAVVGENLYYHQIDSHIAAILRGAWYSWEVAKPEVLGNKRRLAIGHNKLREGSSGMVAALIDKMGLHVNDQQLNMIFSELRKKLENQVSIDIEEAKEIIYHVLDINKKRE